MADHLVRPVEFVTEIEAMYQDGARVFLELGPKSVLTRLTGKILEGRPHLAIAIDDDIGLTGMLSAFAQLLCAGLALDVMKLYEGRDCLIGDPAKPESLLHNNAVSKHAWMLNGSGARRSADPIRQIGVTVDQPPPQPLTAKTDAALPPAVSAPSSMTTTQSVRRKERHMAERRPTPVAGDSAIMSEYFDTMRQFLETQERVMAMFMGEPIVGRDDVRLPRRTPALALSRVPDLDQAPVKVHTKPTIALAAQNGAAAATASAAPVVAGPPHVVTATRKPNGMGGNGIAKPAEQAPATAGIDRAKMTEMLFAVVEDKTGYPRDMVGLDQNLEADLGIDSIKRIEVVGAMLQKLPETYRTALGDGRSRLNTQPTLNGMLNMLSEIKMGGATVPFEDTGVGAAAAVVSHLPRYTIFAKQEGIEATALKQLKQGHFLVTKDAFGVAQTLSYMLVERGYTVTLIERDVLGDEARLGEWNAEQKGKIAVLAGVVHLAPISAAWLPADAPLQEWRRQLQLNEKSIFMLARDFGDKLADGAHILSASGLGGFFNRQGSAGRGMSMQGGTPGMLKSLFEERPGLRVKAVDIDTTQQPADIASILFAEMELVGGRQEVGYPEGKRTVFHTVAASVDTDAARSGDLHGLVVLATGGARGVTAEVLRELALPGNTLVLTGRHPLPEVESEALRALITADALRQHFIADVRAGGSQITPAEIRRKVQSVLAMREMRSNIEDFRRRGATVEYHAVDVTNEIAMCELLNGVYARHNGIGGVLHGAGVIEDKLLADKKGESWSRVVDTKVMGLLLLQRYLRPESLKFFTVFSSVAGRYGNSGQSDYATANELMNRLCGQLRNHWGGRVRVKALCWGPWGPTKFGAGMVTAETEAKFAEKDVRLVTAEIGRRLFKDELMHGGNSPVEIICGEGPWEQRETANGEIKKNSQALDTMIEPLLGSAIVTALPKGDQRVSICLDANHAYLQQHCIDGVPILPAAVALEIMAEAARSLWRGWKVVEVRDCRLMKGVELKEYGRKLIVVINTPPYGSSEGFDVNAKLQSEQEDGKPLIHYRAVLRLEQQLPSSFEQVPRLHSEKTLTVTKAYSEWLFHGPCFQVIENIEGLSTAGGRALIKSTSPENWLPGVASDHNNWLFDPAVVDAAAQMAILWARSFRGETALPTRFGRVVRYRETLPERMYMGFERIMSADPNALCANVHYSDAAGQVVLSVEEMECVTSAALNRLGGTARSQQRSRHKLWQAASINS